jgi:tetratricopeptide (TPR) repeat protein
MESDHYATLVWNSETHTASDAPLLNGLRIVQGRVEFDLAGREIPADFLAANDAICTGCHEQAAEILIHLADEDLALLAGIPLRTDLLFYLGKLYTACGQLERARDCLHKILSVEPHPIVHYQLSEAYLPDQRCVSRALEHIQRAVSLCPNNAFLLDRLGHCLFEAGRAQEAVLAGERALALLPDSAHLLARLLWRLNYIPQTTRQSLLEGYQRWGRLLKSSPLAAGRPFARSAEGALRVGLLSPDFRRGSAVQLMDPFVAVLPSS